MLSNHWRKEAQDICVAAFNCVFLAEIKTVWCGSSHSHHGGDFAEDVFCNKSDKVEVTSQIQSAQVAQLIALRILTAHGSEA